MRIGSNVRFKTKSRADYDVEKYITHVEDAISSGKPWATPIFFSLYHEVVGIYSPNKGKTISDTGMKRVFSDIDMMCNLSSTISQFVDECKRAKLDKDFFHTVRKTLE